jgi:hypothetical protein
MDERRLRPRCRYPFWRLKFVRFVGLQNGKTINRKFGPADWFCPADGTYYGPNGDNIEPLFEPDEYLPPEMQPPYQHTGSNADQG